jgi:hypothetical protein
VHTSAVVSNSACAFGSLTFGISEALHLSARDADPG